MATFNHHKDLLVVCPYNETHKIALRNQIKHIIECEKKIVSKFSICIYNASHRMVRHEFAQHLKSCPDGRHHLRKIYSSVEEKSEHKLVIADSNAIVESQKPPTPEEVTTSKADSGSDDDWSNDNGPEYSIYGQYQTQNNANVSEEEPQKKLTKNQKKRNRRKAAKEAANVKSIWE